MRAKSSVVLTLVAAAALGCASPSGGPAPTLPQSATPSPVDTPFVSFEGVPAQTVELAVADLALRLGRAPSEIEVISARLVTWPDGSLGCPQPGMAYTQAIVDGSQIVLGIDGRSRVFVYHAGPDGQPFLCPSKELDGGHDFAPPPGYDD